MNLQKTRGYSIVRNWRAMDSLLRLSVSMGLLSGLAGLFTFFDFIQPQFGVAVSLSGLALSIFFLPFAIFTVPPILSLTGSILLLLRSMSAEHRGIAGFIVFIASVPSILMIVTYVTYLWKGTS